MTNIEELRRLAQTATPGPWRIGAMESGRVAIDGVNGSEVTGFIDPEDGHLILAAANPQAILDHLDRLEAAETAWKETDKACRDLTEKVIPNLRESLEAAETELAELRSSMKFRTSLIGRTEAERDALRAAVRHEADCVEACKSEIDTLRAKIEAMERQEPVMWANSSNINSSRINKERGGHGDQHTCSETQTTYHDAPLYALPGAKGEEK